MGRAMLKTFFLFLILLSQFALGEDSIVSDCRLMTAQGKIIMTFPGKRCEFLDDGSVISLGNVELRRFGPDGELLWEKKLVSESSTFKLSRDGKSLLTVGLINGKLPFDPSVYHFRIYDLNGSLLKENDSFELFGPKKNIRVTDFGEGKGDQYFVNVFHEGLHFLNKDLKKIVKVMKIPGTENHSVKEMQLTEKGTFVFLHQSEKRISLEEYTSGNAKSSKLYPPGDGASFFFPYGGSLSLNHNSYIINHPFAGTFVVSRKSKLIEDFFVESHVTDTFRPPRHVSIKNLEAFFSRWKF